MHNFIEYPIQMNAKGLRVLLIDDTVLILQQLQHLLAEVKKVAKTASATSAEQALEMLEEFQPDVMILDISMPGMGGIEMLRQISTNKPFNRPIVIMLTNNTFSGYKDECMRLGADYFLDKSRDFMMIPSIVEKVEDRNVLQY